ALERDGGGDRLAVGVARGRPARAGAEHADADLAEAEPLRIFAADADVPRLSVGADDERDEGGAADAAGPRLGGEVPIEIRVVRGAGGRGPRAQVADGDERLARAADRAARGARDVAPGGNRDGLPDGALALAEVALGDLKAGVPLAGEHEAGEVGDGLLGWRGGLLGRRSEEHT